MNIQKHRSSFIVYVVDSDEERIHNLVWPLQEAGYECFGFATFIESLDRATNTPPHMVILNNEDPQLDSARAIKKVLSLLPETHVFLLTQDQNFKEALALYDLGLYDCLRFPFADEQVLVRAIDRAAQTDYYMYMNEQLAERLNQAPEPDEVTMIEAPASPLDSEEESGSKTETQGFFKPFSEWLEGLYQTKTTELMCRHFLKLIHDELQISGVFFRYYETRRALVATQSVGLDRSQVEGTGVNLSQQEKSFRVQDLAHPEEIRSIKEMVQEVFDSSVFLVKTLDIGSGPLGVFVFLSGDEERQSHPLLHTAFSALRQSIVQSELEGRLHAMGGAEEVRGVLSRHNFLTKVSEEISRARRTQLPVSLILISVDQPSNLTKEYGREEVDLLMRMLAKIFRKNSRVNDVIGRMGFDEFGLVLPHTSRQGATIKAERLRRIVTSADFSKVLGMAPQLTVSLGVSEYPTICRDADELMQTADDALYQVKAKGLSKVCLATPVDGFKPDFEIPTISDQG